MQNTQQTGSFAGSLPDESIINSSKINDNNLSLIVPEEISDLQNKTETSPTRKMKQIEIATQVRRTEEDDSAFELFQTAERHYLIMTNSGKPVFSM